MIHELVDVWFFPLTSLCAGGVFVFSNVVGLDRAVGVVRIQRNQDGGADVGIDHIVQVPLTQQFSKLIRRWISSELCEIGYVKWLLLLLLLLSGH